LANKQNGTEGKGREGIQATVEQTLFQVLFQLQPQMDTFR